MKKSLITTLRDRNTGTARYRAAVEQLAMILAAEVGETVEFPSIMVETPLETTEGTGFPTNIVLVPILRAGLSLLPAFMRLFTHARVGMIGARRDEKTFHPNVYYNNLPKLSPDDEIILLDPMIATGGSTVTAIRMLIEAGAREERIQGVFVIGAPEGLKHLKDNFPKVRVHCAQVDKGLNSKRFIVPGLGDFGDRFFGTERDKN